ncbi:MAG: ATP-binding protein [Nitrospirales bacterium]
MNETTEKKNRRILIIDDNQAIHEDFRKILTGDDVMGDLAAVEAAIFGESSDFHSSEGFLIECADQGELGLTLVEQAVQANCPFAMAFVDMRMPPGWDGVETTEKLWNVDPDLQIVICTAYSDHHWGEMTRRLGNSDKLLILRKPFDLIEVQQLADSLTHKWDLEHRARRHVESLVQAEQALQRAFAETEGLVSAISSILIGMDEHNCIVRWNEPAEHILGLSASMVLGKSIQSLTIQWEWDIFMIAVQDCRAQQQSLRIPELRYVDHSGAERFLGMTLSPIPGESKAQPGILILGKDITQEKRIEAQLVIAQKMKSIGQLAAGVAHEMNTPLHYIAENIRFLTDSFQDLHRLLDSYGDLAQKTQNGTVNKDVCDMVTQLIKEVDLEYLLREIPTVLAQSLEGTDRVTEIVCAMNEFSHPGTGEKTSVNINHSLQSAITLSSQEWKDVAEVVTDFAEDLPLVPCVAGQMTQVWLNLIVNAAHAIQSTLTAGSAGKGVLTISTKLDREWVEVCVADTGIGIPESIQAQVFDLFFTTKEVGVGTGQGLSLAHSIIVNNHDGLLTFESLPLGGTMFIVRLPLCPVGVEVIGVEA